MKLSKLKYVLLLSVVAMISVALVRPDNKYFEIARNLDIFATLFKEVNTFYVDEVDPEKTIRTGIEAMLSSLDPYTNYIPEEDMEAYSLMITGKYAGIGSLIGVINGRIMITMPNDGFPAANAGLKIGDEIIKVDGLDVVGKSTSDVSKLLKGNAGTNVSVTVRRAGQGEPLIFEIKRAEITLPNVPYHGIVNENIGYIKLAEFTTDAGKEVKQAVLDLKAQGATSIVLDVRENPGGLLHEAVNICNVFIPKNKLVVETKGKLEQWNQTYKTLNSATDTKIPLVVLTSTGSASASEIVSGTIQDYDRGVLVGRRTFGKGLVQATRPLAYNSQLKVTTAKYYIPSGRCIQAVDYSNRNPDGSVGKVPDSLMVAFKTTNGRTVYDGGGVKPDIEVNPEYYSSLAIGLINAGLIFEYALEYVQQHPEPQDIQNFEISDAEYDKFKLWLKDKDFEYSSRLESSIEELVSAAREEDYYDRIEEEIELLKKEVAHNRERDLETFKEEIVQLLSERINGHFYFQKGEIAASLKYDADLKAAIEILNDPENYSSLLAAQ